ncbi:hypothetical protein GcC1_063007, partial [Golovinomyces cichoracearum]
MFPLIPLIFCRPAVRLMANKTSLNLGVGDSKFAPGASTTSATINMPSTTILPFIPTEMNSRVTMTAQIAALQRLSSQQAGSSTLHTQAPSNASRAQSLAPITGTPSRTTSKPPAKCNATTTKATATKNTKNAKKNQAVRVPVKATAKHATTRPHELWNEEETIFMIDLLRGAMDEGKVSDGGFKQKVFNELAEEFKYSFNAPGKTAAPELFVWKDKPFPYYEAMKSLVDENGGATGLYAVNCSQAEHSEEEEENNQQTEVTDLENGVDEEDEEVALIIEVRTKRGRRESSSSQSEYPAKRTCQGRSRG